MAFYVYILRCSDGSYYTGHTDNLEKRIAEHQRGEFGGYTSTRQPVTLLWSQECATREEVLAAERQIKGWSRKKKESMMRGDWKTVQRIAWGTIIHCRRGCAEQPFARELQRRICPFEAKPALKQRTAIAGILEDDQSFMLRYLSTNGVWHRIVESCGAMPAGYCPTPAD